MPWSIPRFLTPLVVAALAVGGLAAGFGVVEYRSAGGVAPSVELEGRPVGEMNADELMNTVVDVGEAIEATPVSIRFAGRAIETTGGEIGVEVDLIGSGEAALAAGRRGSFPERLGSWISTIGAPREVAAVWSVDVADVQRFLTQHPDAIVSLPDEPEVSLRDGVFEVIAGVEGLELDVEATAEMVVESFVPERSVVVDAPTRAIPTEVSNSAAIAFVDELNAVTSGGATVAIGGERGRLSEATLRSVLDIEGWPNDPSYAFDAGLLQERLARLFAEVAQPGTEPVMEVDDGEPVVVEPGEPARVCCAPNAGDVLVEALEAGVDGVIEIPTIASRQAEDVAAGAGVVEVVGEFTTEHQCCQSRVDNIHRIADLIRGVYLSPGERFSVNEFIGRRTRENGFVPAGVIEQGRFTDDVGGGISQFATTFFNAAFFAGLDLEEYQSHSIYISRYPYGREATLSFPKPDLVVRNTTQFPVLIWTSYTDTSITVSLYSTRHIEVEETGQESRPARRCTQVETFRSRTYPDGREVDDSVIALYRPAEGLDCNGNPTPQQP